MSKRKLRPDELELWQQVAAKTERMHRTQTSAPEVYQSQPKRPVSEPKKPITLDGKNPPKPVTRKISYNLAPSLPDQLQKAPVQMDKKTYSKMNRGKVKPEGRIDLHGMTMDRAHGALTQFIMSSHRSGRRLVLVITGKGKNRDEGGPIPVRHGVLRHQVPQWLGQQPLKSVVMQVSQAHASHGGGGAYYVYLRRHR
ncbi:MAG: Smr/MutS family protein [Roseobacter sp.]